MLTQKAVPNAFPKSDHLRHRPHLHAVKQVENLVPSGSFLAGRHYDGQREPGQRVARLWVWTTQLELHVAAAA